jgi:hypothetical protein
MATTITKRVPSGASTNNTSRVTMGSHNASYDCWGGSWGSAWLLAWQNFLSASELSGNITQRVTTTQVTSNHTKRVTL